MKFVEVTPALLAMEAMERRRARASPCSRLVPRSRSINYMIHVALHRRNVIPVVQGAGRAEAGRAKAAGQVLEGALRKTLQTRMGPPVHCCVDPLRPYRVLLIP